MVCGRLDANPPGRCRRLPPRLGGSLGVSSWIRFCVHTILPPIVALMAVGWLEGRSKKDVVFLKNGDRLTCEIKSLQEGQLSVKTDYASGTIALDLVAGFSIAPPVRRSGK